MGEGVLLVLLFLLSFPAWAQVTIDRTLGQRLYAGEMAVPLHKSQVLRLDQPFGSLSVGNPEIADVMALSDRSLYVLGKGLGSTNLAVYDRNRQLMAVLDLVVSHDIARLKAQLAEVLPGEPIEVRLANEAVVLSGTVSAPDRLARAVALANRFAPDRVTNLLKVKGSQQVMLKVKVAEIARSTARELGIKPSLNISNGDFVFNTLDPVAASRFATATLRIATKFMTADMVLDALEEKGVVKILAEPNLVAVSGDTARFLAGGEFPIPVAQTATGNTLSVTIEWKQFGVSLAFTPTVIDGDLINLIVSPEVSQIDRASAVTFTGFSVPGLSTRRATTTVELKDGQSFAVAGLLQSDFTDTVRQVPGIGEIPVLGALFRSSAFLRKETELVIIVTPRLVKPAPTGSLAAPTDAFLPPADVDLFFWGNTEAPQSGRLPLPPVAEGGVAGPYGYLVR
ncbi:MAG: type II and III secretion system protein family protein [Magnetospirillum sp.]|nr:type II and III secretion system protein family protein [Magnetospirillum sp.]